MTSCCPRRTQRSICSKSTASNRSTIRPTAAIPGQIGATTLPFSPRSGIMSSGLARLNLRTLLVMLLLALLQPCAPAVTHKVITFQDLVPKGIYVREAWCPVGIDNQGVVYIGFTCDRDKPNIQD